MFGARGSYEPFFLIWINDEDLAEEILSNVRQFSFEDDEEKLDELKFTIIDKEMTLQGHKQLQEGATVKAKWGYLDGLSETRECKIEEVEYNFPENGLPEIVIKALDKGTALIKEKDRKCYNNVTGTQVIEEKAIKHGLKACIYIPEDFEMEHVAQGGKSDFDFIKEIAAERGCIAWVENSELHVAVNEIGKDGFKLGYQTGNYFLLSARIKKHGVQGAGERTGTEVAGMDPSKKQTVSEEGTSTGSDTDDTITFNVRD